MNSKRFTMYYGTILGLCLVSTQILIWIFNINQNESIIPSLLNNVLIICAIIYTIILFRDHENNGFISYSESLKMGTSVVFFSSIILSFYTFIFTSYIEPNFINEILESTEQAILINDPEISDEDLDLAISISERFMQPHWMFIFGILGSTFMGFIYSLIISIFVKKVNPNQIT